MTWKNSWLIVAIIIVTSLVFYSNYSKSTQANAGGALKQSVEDKSLPKSELAGEMAPSFKLKGLDGKTYQVEGKRNKPLLLTFFASWCEACGGEADSVQKLYEQYNGQLDIYAVNVTSQDKIADVKKFVKAHHMNLPVLLDEDEKAAGLYNLNVLPTAFLINPNGQIQEVFDYLPYEQLVAIIEKKI